MKLIILLSSPGSDMNIIRNFPRLMRREDIKQIIEKKIEIIGKLEEIKNLEWNT